MTNIPSLGEFEHCILLAVLRLQQQGAYGVSIGNEIERRTQRAPTPGAIYATLDRLETKALLRSTVGESTPERGGRSKRYYHLTNTGLGALRRAHADYQSLSQGLDLLGGARG